jgi:hypothetical protein
LLECLEMLFQIEAMRRFAVGVWLYSIENGGSDQSRPDFTCSFSGEIAGGDRPSAALPALRQ